MGRRRGAARLAGPAPLPGPISQVHRRRAAGVVGGFANRARNSITGTSCCCLDRTDFNGGGSTTSGDRDRRGGGHRGNFWGSGCDGWASTTAARPLTKFARMLKLTL